MKNLVLLTGNELRHKFFVKYISNQDGINVLAAFSESSSGNISEIVSKEKFNSLRDEHLNSRSKIEKDFLIFIAKNKKKISI